MLRVRILVLDRGLRVTALIVTENLMPIFTGMLSSLVAPLFFEENFGKKVRPVYDRVCMVIKTVFCSHVNLANACSFFMVY